MHVDAVSAAVDLRGAKFDEFKQRAFQPAPVHEGMQLTYRLGAFRRSFPEVHPGFHWDTFCLRYGMNASV
jgi:hypothetical protein